MAFFILVEKLLTIPFQDIHSPFLYCESTRVKANRPRITCAERESIQKTFAARLSLERIPAIGSALKAEIQSIFLVEIEDVEAKQTVVRDLIQHILGNQYAEPASDIGHILVGFLL